MKRLAIAFLLVCTTVLAQSPEVKAVHAEATRLRAERGLLAQVLDKQKCDIAQAHADHMAKVGVVAHGDTGEQIIAWSSNAKEPAIECFSDDLWRGSPGHWDWVMSSATKCGWGIARTTTGKKPGTYWAGAFGGVPDPEPVPPPKPPKPYRPKRPFLDWLFGRR